MNEIPLMLRIEKARNELRFSVNQISAKYDLPGYIIDLIINGVLTEGSRLPSVREGIHDG